MDFPNRDVKVKLYGLVEGGVPCLFTFGKLGIKIGQMIFQTGNFV
jgi:hypothetical protein